MALEFVSEVDKKFFNDNLLFTEDWDDGGGRLPDDLKELLDVDTNLTSDDLMKEFSDNLEIPMLDDLENNQFVEPWHFSDSSDSGLDCGMSIKEEPLSPSSSDASEHSLDTYNQMSLDDTLQGLILPDDVKLESPLGGQDILGESMALASVTMDAMDTMDTMDIMANDSSALTLGVPLATMAPSNLQQKSIMLMKNENLTQVFNSKVKIKPKPLLPMTQTSFAGSQVVSPSAVSNGSGKPLVLTAEEFAKLTSQGVLKIQSSVQSTANATPIVAAKPIVSASAISQVKQLVTPVTAPAHSIDSKAVKRQQRMIKNRESACLSRKRKKEYLTSMEERLKGYLQENEKLKHVNMQLKRKVELLETENQRLKGGIFNPNAKKASLLLGVMLLFAVNFLPMASILNGNTGLSPSAESQGLIHHGRTLMSMKEETPESSNSQQRPLPADPYTIIRETLRRGGVRKDLARRALEEYTIPISMCPSYFNSTESLRLMDELNGWVLGHKTERKKKQQQKEEDKKQVERQLKRQRKLRRNRQQQKNNAAKDVTENSLSEGRYEIQLFTGADTNYQQLFDAIHRRNDTFYVVSFRRDHLLLPATSHNKTMRPRMSLVMPAVSINDSINSGPGIVSMMQIDCEVMDTRLVSVSKSAVPLEMRETNNSTQKDWPKPPPPTWPHTGAHRHVPRH